MAEEAKKLGDGSFGAEVVGTPTSLQLELEKLIADREIQPANEPSAPPPARSGVRNTLAGETEVPESKVDPVLRGRAEAALDYIRSLPTKAAKTAYRQELESTDPGLFDAVKALIAERRQASLARSEATANEMEAAAATHEAAHQVLGEALSNVVAGGRKKLASGE